eukprot:GHVR01041192.1.p1 GENE.GHVR01041192.1~~GHVR01041192.1.p1  ORF type:complete len:127 (-),score=4.55 GHVR01041192.1:1232-1612(-)
MRIQSYLVTLLVATYSSNLKTSNASCIEDCCKSLPHRSAMTYHYYQNTGRIIGGEGNYYIDTHGYSGQGKGYLNPDYQCVPNIGPLPVSTYNLHGVKMSVQRPRSFFLEPQNQNKSEMCGRIGDIL